MADHKHFISIWFFIGALLAVYGVLILGVGIYDVFHPVNLDVQLRHLHMPVWWGIALIALGGVYLVKFWPKKER